MKKLKPIYSININYYYSTQKKNSTIKRKNLGLYYLSYIK